MPPVSLRKNKIPNIKQAKKIINQKLKLVLSAKKMPSPKNSAITANGLFIPQKIWLLIFHNASGLYPLFPSTLQEK